MAQLERKIMYYTHSSIDVATCNSSKIKKITVFPCFRYILDNGEIVKNRQILDIGCGCGAGAIAAAKMKAKKVLANDIDPCKFILLCK